MQLIRRRGDTGIDDVEAALEEARTSDTTLWIDLDRPEGEGFSALGRSLALHPLAIEDAVDALERPKLDLYDEHKFFSLVTLRRSQGQGLTLGRVMVFLGKGFVVTVSQEDDGDTVERAQRQLHKMTDEPTPLAVLHAVVDTVVDDLTATSSSIEDRLLASADRLFAPQPSDEARSLYELTRELLALAHAVQPLIEPLRHLSSGDVPHIPLEIRRHFQDVLDHALVLDREVRDHNELLEHLRGSNDSRIGLQQNTDMRKIAAWAAVIAVPTAVTGFYGMNLPYPGFEQVSGFVTAVVVQIVSVAVLFTIFRRRGWL